jgi:hypothetical protein
MKRRTVEKEVSSNVKVLVMPVDRCTEEVIAKLEELLELARSGQIVSIAGIANCADTYFVFETRALSRLQTAGALLDAAINRLGYKVS